MARLNGENLRVAYKWDVENDLVDGDGASPACSIGKPPMRRMQRSSNSYKALTRPQPTPAIEPAPRSNARWGVVTLSKEKREKLASRIF
jgi:hypothetical protein